MQEMFSLPLVALSSDPELSSVPVLHGVQAVGVPFKLLATCRPPKTLCRQFAASGVACARLSSDSLLCLMNSGTRTPER